MTAAKERPPEPLPVPVRPSPSRPWQFPPGHGAYQVYWNIVGSLDWFKGKSTGNHGFYHQI